MNILAFGASSSSKSINRTFAKWAVSQIDQAEAITPDLNDYE
ncbi:MAG: NAD(P)H-dependent FMN reductase, partial [Limisphaerales bacterium]